MKSTTDSTASLVLRFGNKLMCSDIVLLKSEGVLFIKLLEEIFRFEFGIFLFTCCLFLASMECHEFILLKGISCWVNSLERVFEHYRLVVHRWYIVVLIFRCVLIFQPCIIVTSQSERPIVRQHMLLVWYGVVQRKRWFCEIFVVLVIKLKVDGRSSFNYLTVHHSCYLTYWAWSKERSTLRKIAINCRKD